MYFEGSGFSEQHTINNACVYIYISIYIIFAFSLFLRHNQKPNGNYLQKFNDWSSSGCILFCRSLLSAVAVTWCPRNSQRMDIYKFRPCLGGQSPAVNKQCWWQPLFSSLLQLLPSAASHGCCSRQHSHCGGSLGSFRRPLRGKGSMATLISSFSGTRGILSPCKIRPNPSQWTSLMI